MSDVQEPDAVVGNVLEELLDAYEADCSLNNRDADAPVLEKSRGIVVRLKDTDYIASPSAR